jgi:outer membrane protein assembly factor BamB/PKD repeat protein
MRTKGISTILALLLVGTLCLPFVIKTGNAGFNITSTGSPWPMFRHDLTHSGYAISIAPNNNATVWTYLTGDIITSSPAIANGKVFFGSHDYKIYALNEKTGAFLWSYTTSGSVASSPAVADGKVFVGSSDYKLYALNENTGAFLWSFATGSSISSSPAVANGKVFVGSSDGKVYALNQTTGTLLWSYTTGASIRSSPTVADGKVYVGSEDAKLYALDAGTGALAWTYTTGSSIVSSPAVVSGRVYFGSSDAKVYALNATTGALLWSYTTGGSVASSPAVAYGKVYVGSYDSKLYALDAQTGTKIWDFTTGGWVYSSPAVADGKVFFGSYDNNIYALNQATGALIWRYNTWDSVRSSPAVADGMVFIGSSSKKLYVFGVHDVAILNVTPSKTTVVQGEVVNIDVVVKNEGNFSETFDVSLYHDAINLIETRQVSLEPVTSTILTFNWDTSLVSLGNHTISATAQIVAGETDTADNSFTDGVIRIVKYPVARFVYYPTIPKVGEIVTFNANTSTGNGGEIVSYSWDFGDNTYGSGNVTTHAYTSFGNYTVILTVTDSEGLNDTESVTIRVIEYPVASFTYLPTMVVVNETVTFDASTSNPRGGTIISYSWDFGDGNHGSGKIVTHTYTFAGNFVVKLNVTDNEGLWDTTQTTIKAYARPKASFFFYPTAPHAEETVVFNASASIDVDGVIVSYIWNFSDGTPLASGELVTHSFAANGTYYVTLTVTDNDGLSHTMTFKVVVGLTIIGDVTGPYGMPDGKVDMRDIAFVAKAFGTDPIHQGHPPRWDPRADISGPTYGVPDGKVDMYDVALVAKNFGKTVY